jgi:hypothetical protein
LVTFCVVPFDSVAVAANWDVAPTAGGNPFTATLEVVGAAGAGVDVAGVGVAGDELLP